MTHRQAAAIRFTGLTVALTLVLAPRASAFETLDPGGPPDLRETVPVQIVLLGYEPDQVPEATLRASLPTANEPLIRSRNYYGAREPVGLSYGYDYDLVYTEAAYEDAFFAKLTALGVDETELSGNSESFGQFLYNQQPTRVRDIEDNLVIDGTAVERWLVKHPAPGVDPSRNTLVLINWWGRDDFRFHDYKKRSGEPFTETGVDFADLDEWGRSGRTDGWGGTGPHDEETGFGRESRVWFYDLSAGPAVKSARWWLDDAGDVDGDGSGDYRFPPVWEYLTAGGHRPASALADDLAKLTRYVAVDMLFTPSPLFPAYLSDHRLPDTIELDMTVFGSRQPRPVNPARIRGEVGELLAGGVREDTRSSAFKGDVARCFTFFVQNERCLPDADPDVYWHPLSNLFLAAARSLRQWRDGSADYEAGGFIFAVEDLTPTFALGFPDDNWLDGTQSGIFVSQTRESLDAGFGGTRTTIHEYGHHFGLSHPFDGYDAEEGRELFPAGDMFFAGAGGEVNSVMSYLPLNEDFSQFDLDNHRRWQAAAYLRSANAIAAGVLGSRAGAGDLVHADRRFGRAQAALSAHEYELAERRAREGYGFVRQAARKARVAVPASDDGWYERPAGLRSAAARQQKPATSLLCDFNATTTRDWPAAREAQRLAEENPRP